MASPESSTAQAHWKAPLEVGGSYALRPRFAMEPPRLPGEVERVPSAQFGFGHDAFAGLWLAAMTHDLEPVLSRIAEALERLGPPRVSPPAFDAARLFRHEPATNGFHPAPDYPLPLAALVGVDRQKERFVENLQRFADGLPSNHALLWGVRGTGKSS